MGTLMGIFSLLAISIAAVGLFGLVSFITKKRTKEIGIRKANGAKILDLFKLIIKEFIYLLIIANVISWPTAYFIADKILSEFAYRININIIAFVIAGAVSIIITLLTVSFQILKASNTNPIEALRYE